MPQTSSLENADMYMNVTLSSYSVTSLDLLIWSEASHNIGIVSLKQNEDNIFYNIIKICDILSKSGKCYVAFPFSQVVLHWTWYSWKSWTSGNLSGMLDIN